jgi:hypothetical protein
MFGDGSCKRHLVVENGRRCGMIWARAGSDCSELVGWRGAYIFGKMGRWLGRVPNKLYSSSAHNGERAMGGSNTAADRLADRTDGRTGQHRTREEAMGMR